MAVQILKQLDKSWIGAVASIVRPAAPMCSCNKSCPSNVIYFVAALWVCITAQADQNLPTYTAYRNLTFQTCRLRR